MDGCGINLLKTKEGVKDKQRRKYTVITGITLRKRKLY
jgi:hypothetical protein